MFCKKCGKEIAEGLTTCPECNATTQAAQLPAENAAGGVKGFVDGYKDFGSLSKNSKIIHIAVPVVAVIVVAVVLSLIFSKDYVAMVKDSTLDDYSKTVTVGEAFDEFFSDPEWETFKSEDGDRIVEFNGECEYYGEKVNCCVQFEISDDDDYFEVEYMDIDGESLNRLEIRAMLEVIYEG